MPKCKKCDSYFPNRFIIDNKEHVINTRRYCLKCSPFGKHNTRNLSGKEDCRTNKVKIEKLCIICNKNFFTTSNRKNVCNSCKVQKSQKKKRETVIKAFGGKCSKCGYDKCLHALEFHHLRDKKQRPSYIIRRWALEKAMSELIKCELLCANCHREIHFGVEAC